DARRHGVEVRTPDLNESAATAALEGEGIGRWGRAESDAAPEDWGKPGPAVRLRVSYVRGIGLDLAEENAAGRPYTDPEDLARRVPLSLPQLEALATAGAFDCFEMPRREAIWAAGAVAQMGTDRHGAQRLPGIVTGVS